MRLRPVAVLALLPALAQAAPTYVTLPHSGYLLDASDHALDLPSAALSFGIYPGATGGGVLWSGSCSVPVHAGYYAAQLGDGTCGTALDAAILGANPSNFLQISIGSTALEPRLPISAAPTATLAANALALEDKSLADLDARYARVSGAAAAPGQVLKWNGSAWAPEDDLAGTGTVTAVTAVAPLQVTNGTTTPALSITAASASTNGYLSAADWTTFNDKVAPNDPRLNDARTPTGGAGGDLSGNYPNPLVAQLQGRAVASTQPTTGQVLKWLGSTWGPGDDQGSLVQAAAVDYAQLEGPSMTFGANKWTAASFNATPIAQGITVSGTAITFSRPGRYLISLSFRMDSTCGDVWTGVRLFGDGADRGHSTGSGTAVPSVATYSFLANVANASVNYELQLGRLASACTLQNPLSIPDPTNSVPTVTPALQATIVQLASTTASIVTAGAGRKWSDGTAATSCKAYRTPVTGFTYQGQTGDGVYTIDPDGPSGAAEFNAYCDMTTDSGGWTLIATLASTNGQAVSGWTGWSDGWWAATHGDPTSTTAAFTNHDLRKFRPIVNSTLVLRASNPVNAVKRYQWGMSQADWDLWNAGRTVGTVNVVGPFNVATVFVSTSPALTGGVQAVSNGHWFNGFFYLGTGVGQGDADTEGLGARYEVQTNSPPSYGFVGGQRVNTTWNLWVK